MKKSKNLKLKDVVIILALMIITVGASWYIADKILENNSQEQKQYAKISELEYYFQDSKVEFSEKYKKKYIYKVNLDEKTYYVAYNEYGESISKSNANANMVKYNDSTRLVYTNEGGSVLVFYEIKNGEKGDYVLTLYASKSDLKKVLDKIG